MSTHFSTSTSTRDGQTKILTYDTQLNHLSLGIQSSALLSGYVKKQSKNWLGKNIWKSKYGVITSKCILWYLSEEDWIHKKQPDKIMNIQNIHIETDNDPTIFIIINKNEKKRYYKVTSNTEVQTWINTILSLQSIITPISNQINVSNESHEWSSIHNSTPTSSQLYSRNNSIVKEEDDTINTTEGIMKKDSIEQLMTEKEKDENINRHEKSDYIENEFNFEKNTNIHTKQKEKQEQECINEQSTNIIPSSPSLRTRHGGGSARELLNQLIMGTNKNASEETMLSVDDKMDKDLSQDKSNNLVSKPTSPKNSSSVSVSVSIASSSQPLAPILCSTSTLPLHLSFGTYRPILPIQPTIRRQMKFIPVNHVNLPMLSVDELWNFAFIDNAPCSAITFHAVCNDKDVQVSKWHQISTCTSNECQMALQTLQSHHIRYDHAVTRDCSYQLHLNSSFPFGAKTTRVYKVNKCWRDHENLYIETVTVTPDVPAADCFQIIDQWIVRTHHSNVHGISLHLSVSVAIQYVKKALKIKMIQSTLEKRLLTDIKTQLDKWVTMVKEEWKKHRRAEAVKSVASTVAEQTVAVASTSLSTTQIAETNTLAPSIDATNTRATQVQSSLPIVPRLHESPIVKSNSIDAFDSEESASPLSPIVAVQADGSIIERTQLDRCQHEMDLTHHSFDEYKVASQSVAAPVPTSSSEPPTSNPYRSTWTETILMCPFCCNICVPNKWKQQSELEARMALEKEREMIETGEQMR